MKKHLPSLKARFNTEMLPSAPARNRWPARNTAVVSPRTITRDLNLLREANPALVIPLRSTVHDIGPVLTHRTKIVCLALEGKTMTQICHITRHTPPAINNYLSTFVHFARALPAGAVKNAKPG